MPHNANPLAAERFRTIVTEAAGHGLMDDDPDVIRQLLDAFPDAHFEYQTNAAGVRMRRVAVASEWEVDPLPAWMATS